MRATWRGGEIHPTTLFSLFLTWRGGYSHLIALFSLFSMQRGKFSYLVTLFSLFSTRRDGNIHLAMSFSLFSAQRGGFSHLVALFSLFLAWWGPWGGSYHLVASFSLLLTRWGGKIHPVSFVFDAARWASPPRGLVAVNVVRWLIMSTFWQGLGLDNFVSGRWHILCNISTNVSWREGGTISA